MIRQGLILVLLVSAIPVLAEPIRPTGKPLEVRQNEVAEWRGQSTRVRDDPFNEVTLDALVTLADGSELRVPAFWAGKQEWRFRFSSPVTGRFPFRTVCSDTNDAGLHDQRGVIEVTPYRGNNRLLQHGPVHLSANRRYFAHADGTPFFWLADSWWHAMSSRLTMDGFKTLVADRVAKGFNVIQFAVANPCDIAPFDDRGGNEAGHAWTKDFGTINPAYWDLTDQRVAYLIEQGLMPSIMGTWGYYLHFMGEEKMKRHWRYVIARYGAFPVAWILCGESRLPWYPLIGKGDDGYQQTLKWTELSKTVRDLNTTRRLLGIHPGPPLWFHDATYEALSDYSAVDVYFGMGGHGGGDEYPQVLRALKTMEQWRATNPGKLAIVGELCWEGMYGGNCGPFVQRIQFWGAVLNGAPGHCYGTDSLWQMNSREATVRRVGVGLHVGQLAVGRSHALARLDARQRRQTHPGEVRVVAVRAAPGMAFGHAGKRRPRTRRRRCRHPRRGACVLLRQEDETEAVEARSRREIPRHVHQPARRQRVSGRQTARSRRRLVRAPCRAGRSTRTGCWC